MKTLREFWADLPDFYLAERNRVVKNGDVVVNRFAGHVMSFNDEDGDVLDMVDAEGDNHNFPWNKEVSFGNDGDAVLTDVDGVKYSFKFFKAEQIKFDN